MSEHRASIAWTRSGEFRYESYSRSHSVDFGGGVGVPGSAAPANIPPGTSTAPGMDPEQALVAALSACHMLWFLHLACSRKYVVERYRDDAIGVLGKNAAGKEAIVRVSLRPEVSFTGTAPTPEQFHQLHEKAHQRCFIANTVSCDIVLEPRIA